MNMNNLDTVIRKKYDYEALVEYSSQSKIEVVG
jgi:hypothetical protein